jgi:hypothetical protein
MPTEPEPLTLAQAVHRAVNVVDPNDDDLADLLRRFEDADEPVSAVDDVAQRMAEAIGALDPEAEVPAVQVAGAVATYLAFRRDEVSDDDESLIRLAVRAEFDGNPPPNVAGWLDDHGIEY